MSGSDLVDAIVACERAISHLQATQAALTAAFSRPGVAGDLTGLTEHLTSQRGAARGPAGRIDPDLLAAHQQEYARSLAATEIAAALHLPHRTASSRVDAARELVDQLPVTWQALRAGRIDQRRAAVIAAGTRCLRTEVRAAAEAAVAPLAGDRIPRHLQELLDRAVIAADPDAAVVREREARAGRAVRHYPDRNGMGKIHADLTAEGAATVFTLLDLLAQATNGATEPDGTRRGIDARRADALTDIATELLATGQVDLTALSDAHQPDGSDQRPNPGSTGGQPTTANASADTRQPATDTAPAGSVWRGLSRHGRRPHLVITVGMSTLAGLDRLPGHLAGHGAITAELATSIARAYQTLSLAGIEPATGTASAVTATVYRPRQSLVDQTGTLAPHCRFPSCRQPAWRSDHDHRVPFNHLDPASGGLTSLWDCDPECRRHHVLKTHAQWNAEGRPDRSIVWTSPTAHRYTTRPAEYRIPGEDSDPHWSDLIVPATWPAPAPEPPFEPSSELPPESPSESPPGSDPHDETASVTDDVEPPSPAMREFLAKMRLHDQQMARFQLIGTRLRRALRSHRAAPDGPVPDCHAPNGRGPGRHEPGQGARHVAGSDPLGTQPFPHRHRSWRDLADQAAIERAIRLSRGLPDPNDDPPPF